MKKRDRISIQALEGMQTQELEAILRTELEKDIPDRELAMGILHILEKRDADSPIPTNIDEEAVREKFMLCREQMDKRMEACTSEKRSARWLPKVAVAAVLVIALVLITPPALGAESIVELVGRWSQDIFALFWSDSQTDLSSDYVFQTDHPGLQELYDTVAEAGITQRVVPMWVPEECGLVELITWDTPEGTKVQAKLTDNNSYMLIVFEPYINKPYINYPKDNVDVITHDTNGTKHYMMPNDGTWTVVWSAEDIACLIVTTYDESTIYKILDSIYIEGD